MDAAEGMGAVRVCGLTSFLLKLLTTVHWFSADAGGAEAAVERGGVDARLDDFDLESPNDCVLYLSSRRRRSGRSRRRVFLTGAVR